MGMAMKITLVLILLLTSTAVAAVQNTGDSADTLDEGNFQTGVFAPLRMGLGANTELATHPLVDFVLPHLYLKHRWIRQSHFSLATLHYLSYPSQALRLVARPDIGGLLPANTDIPHMLTSYNSLVLSWQLPKGLRLSPRIGLQNTVGGTDSSVPTIDLPFIYYRTSSHHHGHSIRGGVELDQQITSRWQFVFDIGYFYLPGTDGHFAWEHKSYLQLHLGPSTSLLFGYLAVAGRYPFGQESRLLPLADFIWSW